jgi:hypothetical protein
MNEYQEIISYKQAREIASKAAFEALTAFFDGTPKDALREYSIEGEHCWFFFRNTSIDIPEEMAFGRNFAYAVSKKGALRYVYDFSYDTEKLTEYLRVMSDYFSTHDE